MVRCGTLPLRKLAIEYGASMVYSEEIIDRKIAMCRREVNTGTGLISYTYDDPNGSKKYVPAPVFVTYPNERVVFQMGTNNGPSALVAAQIVANDVRAFDINMGCPKHFSIQDGMGSALLCNPESSRDILSTLSRNLGEIPLTCKIRLLDTVQETVAHCR
jgi:tRNA-dihydrouridine synthase 2